MKTPVCFAGDINKNYLEIYALTKVNWENDTVEVIAIESESESKPRSTFYRDAVALVPMEIIESKTKLKLLDAKKTIEIDREIKARRKSLLKEQNGSRSEIPSVEPGSSSSAEQEPKV